jgi:PAS domain S-box-containing protein
MTFEASFLLVGRAATRERLAPHLVEREVRLLEAVDARQALGWIEGGSVAVTVMDLPVAEAERLLADVVACCPDMPVVAVVSAGDRTARMTAWRHLRIFDYLTRPVPPLEWELTAERALDAARLRYRLRRGSDRIDRERLTAVRQIVDRMSSVIAQVADDVQGGVKYFNELPYFVSIHDRNCRVVSANRTYEKYLPLRPSMPSWEIYVGRRATARGCPVGRTINSGRVERTQALVRYASGARVPVIVHTAPIFNDNAGIELILEVFAGTREIDRLAEEVRTTQQRYRQLFEVTPCHIVVLDRRFRITAVNSKFKEAFGDRTGDLFFDTLRPARFPAYRDPISRTMRDGLPREGFIDLADVDGIRYHMRALTAPITTRSGKLIQVLAIFSDITERRKMQQDLSALGLMMATVSHNLKGSLTGLNAGLYLMEAGFYRNLPGQIEEGLEVSKLMADRIRKLSREILYSTKKRRLEIEPVDVADFAEDLIDSISRRMRGADISFNCRIAPDLGTFEVDPGMLRSALLNILENAMEAHISDPRPHDQYIEFSVAPIGPDVCFDIRDNGPGMDEEQSKQAFALFYSSKGRRGTGLGLYITQKVVQKHGGSVTVTSHAGQGAKFRIRLPRTVPAADGRQSAPEGPPRP